MIKVAVRGSRSDQSEWMAAQNTPLEKLPALTPEQLKVAAQMHLREEDYQRLALASNRTMEKLLKETEWFAKILQRKLKERIPEASIESVILNTWDHKFEVAVTVNQSKLPLRVSESIVDDLFDLGPEHSDRRLSSLLDEYLLRVGVS